MGEWEITILVKTMDRRSGFGLVGVVSGLILGLFGEILAFEVGVGTDRYLVGAWFSSLLRSADLRVGDIVLLIGLTLVLVSLYLLAHGKRKDQAFISS